MRPPRRPWQELAAEIGARGVEERALENCGAGQRGSTRLAWREVWLQHDLRHAGGQPEKLLLVVDWPSEASEPYHYYLAHLKRPPTKPLCLKLSRSRWHIEQYFQRSKDDLGLDHFEGRSWTSLSSPSGFECAGLPIYFDGVGEPKKNFWCHVGTDAPGEASVAGEIHKLLLLLRNEI